STGFPGRAARRSSRSEAGNEAFLPPALWDRTASARCTSPANTSPARHSGRLTLSHRKCSQSVALFSPLHDQFFAYTVGRTYWNGCFTPVSDSECPVNSRPPLESSEKNRLTSLSCVGLSKYIITLRQKIKSNGPLNGQVSMRFRCLNEIISRTGCEIAKARSPLSARGSRNFALYPAGSASIRALS